MADFRAGLYNCQDPTTLPSSHHGNGHKSSQVSRIEEGNQHGNQKFYCWKSDVLSRKVLISQLNTVNTAQRKPGCRHNVLFTAKVSKSMSDNIQRCFERQNDSN
jgi:hypothetical protein